MRILVYFYVALIYLSEYFVSMYVIILQSIKSLNYSNNCIRSILIVSTTMDPRKPTVSEDMPSFKHKSGDRRSTGSTSSASSSCSASSAAGDDSPPVSQLFYVLVGFVFMLVFMREKLPP